MLPQRGYARRVQQIEVTSAPPENNSHAGWVTDGFSPGRFAGLLALLIFATFPQVLLGWQTFVVRDFGFFAYPLAHFQRECFWRGELPLWNPYNNCGVPFLAQWNTLPLYPPVLLYLLAPLAWSLGFFCLLHLWFAGLGAYFLARRWTGNNFAAAFAGVAFAFNGLTLNLLMWPSHIATFAWMPWVVLLVERAWREGGRKIFLAALAGAMQMLAGGPETILFTWLLLAAMWVMDWSAEFIPLRRRDNTRSGLKFALRFPFVVLLVAALAAAQLLPFLDLAAHSQREPGYADTRWSMPAWGWVNFLVPMAFARVSNMGVLFQSGQGWTSSYYLGMAALLLALLAVWSRRERRVGLLAAVAGCALVFAFGDQTFVYRSVRQLIPQLSLMTYPVKFVTLVAFIVPLLAALALARWCSAVNKGERVTPCAPQTVPPGGAGAHGVTRPTRSGTSNDVRSSKNHLVLLAGMMLALIAVVLLWAWRSPFPADNVRATLLNGLTRAVFLIVSVGLLVALARAVKPGFQRFAPLALILVAWLDVVTHAPPQNPSVAPWIYEPGLARAKLAMQPQPALGESRAMVTPAAEERFRQFVSSQPADNFIVKRLGYFADCNLLDAVPKVNGFFSLYPREGGELNSVLYDSTNAHFPRLLNFLGVSQITSREKLFEWEARTNFLPLVTAGQTPVFLDDTNALRSLLRPDFDGSKVVFLPPEAKSLVSERVRVKALESGLQAAGSAEHAKAWTPTARLKGWRFAAQRVDLEVDAEATSLVVVAQTYYHRWRAYVDGKPAPLLRANYAFQAVEVPAGHHRIRLAYEDRAFQIGALISGVSWLVCASACARRKRLQPPNRNL